MRIEKLVEGIGPRKLYHFTTYDALTKILSTKKLKAFHYPGTKTGTSQIATVRPSMASKKNIGQLSTGTEGGVKLIFDASKMSDSVRGLKIKKIAEFYTIHLDEIKEKLNIKDDKKLRVLLKDLDAHYDKFGDTYDELVSDEAAVDLKRIEKKNKVKRLKMAIASYELYRDRMIKREGEERLTVKTGSLIPLDKRYIKIELIKPFETKNIPSKERLQKEVRKNKDFFIQNKILDEILSKEYIGK